MKKKKSFWIWFFAIIFFPITLSVLFWKSDKINLKKPIKGGILAIVWVILFAISGNGNDTTTNTISPDTTIVENTTTNVGQTFEQLIEEQKNNINTTQAESQNDSKTESEVKTEESSSNVVSSIETASTSDIIGSSIIDENKEEVEINKAEEDVVEKDSSEEKIEYTYTEANEIRYADIDMNVRSLPNLSGEVIGKLSQNDAITVTGRCKETGWYRISYNGIEAYASDAHLKTEKVVVSAPVVISPEVQPSSGATSSVTVPAEDTTGEHLVWIPTKGGTRYHTKSTCSNMDGPIQVPIETAEANGFTPCKRCH